MVSTLCAHTVGRVYNTGQCTPQARHVLVVGCQLQHAVIFLVLVACGAQRLNRAPGSGLLARQHTLGRDRAVGDASQAQLASHAALTTDGIAADAKHTAQPLTLQGSDRRPSSPGYPHCRPHPKRATLKQPVVQQPEPCTQRTLRTLSDAPQAQVAILGALISQASYLNPKPCAGVAAHAVPSSVPCSQWAVVDVPQAQAALPAALKPSGCRTPYSWHRAWLHMPCHMAHPRARRGCG